MGKKLLILLLALLWCACALAEPQYYALIIGQDYAESDALQGCANDAAGMEAMLAGMAGTPYRISLCNSLTADEITEKITECFAGAQEEDVCLLYFSGHGKNTARSGNGGLTGSDGSILTPEQLSEALAGVSGTKIVILDSCSSGAAGACLAQADICTLAACADGQEALMLSDGCSLYTDGILRGSGYDIRKGEAGERLLADRNNDGAISVSEISNYAASWVLVQNSGQHACVFDNQNDLILWAK